MHETADSHVSVEERHRVLEWARESHDGFLAAIGGVSDAQWTWKPAADQWSVGETAEHVVLAEQLLFAFVRRAIAAPPNPAWREETRGKTDLLVRVMPSRMGKAVSPDRIVPRDGLMRTQVVQRFVMQRIEIDAFIRETRIALKEHTAVHPFPIFSTLNAYQGLVYLVLHTIRHTKQIEDVKATPGYGFQ